MDGLLLIARLLLVAVFVVAGAAKLRDQTGSRESMRAFGVPALVAPATALLLPLFELACAVALLLGNWVRWGAWGAVVLLVLFIVAIAVNLLLGRKPDCHCFGQIHSSPAGWTTVSRNLVLTALALFVALRGPEFVAPASAGPAVSRTSDAVLVLALVAAGLAGLMLSMFYLLLHQNGRMLRRLDAIEAKLGIKAQEPQTAGLPINSAAPGFSLERLDGGTETLDSLRAGGKPILLFFSEPGCSECDTILPEVGLWQREHADRLVVVPISRGAPGVNRAKAATHNVENVLLQEDREVAQAYLSESTPSAVLVIDGLIASALAVGPKAIRSVVKNATAPPPLAQGDRIPSIALRDLKGGTTDLATLGGRRLLLFWNPSCGFCREMLDDVKAWERGRSADAPELVVISSGSPMANREQGFQSRVLLDSHFTAGDRFGATGTPSAVIVDENGRVASHVAVGARAVMTLAGVPLAELAR
jgi:uncharacterized membrane protein YphA (DoxX/SURF4 family)/peroxiredoxin